MCSPVYRLAGLFLYLVLTTNLAAAENPDLRLVHAVARHDAPTARALLEEGVDVNAARPDGATALLWAAHHDDLAITRLLLSSGAKVNAAEDHGVTPLARACENASLRMIQTLLAAGADPNATQKNGLTPLMTTARTGNLRAVQELLDFGADVNASTIHLEATALMWAVAAPHPKIVQLLLEAGADPTGSTTKGYTTLMYAARRGDIPMARKLIAAGVDINTPSSDGTHILPFAIVNGQDEFALFLLAESADPNGSMRGATALHAAAGSVGAWRVGRRGIPRDRRLPIVKALLARGADPNARITSSAMIMMWVGHPKKGAFETYACGTGDIRGATPLWVAAFGANGYTGDAFGMKSFRQGQHESSAEIIQALLDAGANPHLTTDDKTTPLMMAAGLGRATHITKQPRAARARSAEEAVKALVAAGANVNATNEADFTALHGAAFRGLNEVVQILVENGAKIDARDFRGRTPFRLAEGSKQAFAFQIWPETATLLKQLGANTTLGLPGTVQERLRDVPFEPIHTATNQQN